MHGGKEIAGQFSLKELASHWQIGQRQMEIEPV